MTWRWASLAWPASGWPPAEGAVAVLLVECSPPELDFFARELEAQLPVRVDKVLLSELAVVVRRRKRADRWGAAVAGFEDISRRWSAGWTA